MKKINLILAILFLFTLHQSFAQTQLWGTCQFGGNNGQGTIFSSDGNATNFHSVYSMDSVTGSMPVGGMVLANNGIFYGVTAMGGCHDSCVVYSFNPITGVFTNIHDLYCDSIHGVGAFSSMTLASDGKLYGLCRYGGSNNYGVLYQVDPATNTYTDIYDFELSTQYPTGSLVQLSDGRLYGITSAISGTIFSYDISTANFTVLHSFPFINNPVEWYPKLIKATDGNLYGMLELGGTNNDGLIFKFKPDSQNSYTVVHEFNGSDGSNPFAGLIQASNGLLYGTTNKGGANNYGVIFSFDISTNSLIVLYSFNNTIGGSPRRNLIQASNSKLYGTALGGSIGNGVVFSFDIATNTYSMIDNFSNSSIGSQPDCELFESPLGLNIPSISKSTSLTLFPNPANNTITLHSPLTINNSLLTINDVLGNKIYQQQINQLTESTIDISKWSEGVYFYQLTSPTETTRGKFIKQ